MRRVACASRRSYYSGAGPGTLARRRGVCDVAEAYRLETRHASLERLGALAHDWRAAQQSRMTSGIAERPRCA